MYVCTCEVEATISTDYSITPNVNRKAKRWLRYIEGGKIEYTVYPRMYTCIYECVGYVCGYICISREEYDGDRLFAVASEPVWMEGNSARCCLV